MHVRDYVSLEFFKPNDSFKMSSKAPLKWPLSPWLFSNTSVYVIVGVDRLDKDLTIGQMQGKYFPLFLYPYCSALWGGNLYMNERAPEWPLPRCSLYRNKHEGKNLSISKCSLVASGCRKGGEAEKGKVQSEAKKGKVQSAVERRCCHGFVQCSMFPSMGLPHHDDFYSVFSLSNDVPS